MRTKPQILLAHPGTQHSPRLAAQLECRGMLAEYWTGLAYAAGDPVGELARVASRLPGLQGLSSRVLSGVPGRKIRRVPLNEIRALVRLRFAERLGALHERNRIFQDSIPDGVLKSADAIIGYDTSSWTLVRRAQALQRPLFLDRTIAPPGAQSRILHAVARRFPEWNFKFEPSLPEVERAQAHEHARAHRIVVGSSFVARMLTSEGVDASKVIVNPYGVDWARFNRIGTKHQPPARPLRFLFVGSVIARKGVPVLLEAWKSLPPHDSELWIAGRVNDETARLIPSLPGLHLLHQQTHAAIANVYAECDVLVLPTYLEGFSLVVLEALASGLPVVATPASGAEEILANPKLGRLVEAGNIDALVEALRHYIHNPPRRSEVAEAAASLQQHFTWAAYGARWEALLRQNV